MKRSLDSEELGPPFKQSNTQVTGGKVVSARIIDLYRPDQNPLGGFTIDDLHSLFAGAGKIEKIVCCSRPATGPPLTHVDALVQYASAASAADVVTNWQGASLTFDEFNNVSEVKYSKHSELTVQNNNRCLDNTVGNTSLGDFAAQTPEAIVAQAEAIAAARERLGLGGSAPVVVPRPNGAGAGAPVVVSPPRGGAAPAVGWGSGGLPGLAVANGAEGKQGTVVVVRITHLQEPYQDPLGGVTPHQVYELFSGLGPVLRIVCSSVPKAAPYTRVDALVEFESADTAETSINLFSGQSLYEDGHCTMLVEKSTRPTLTINANNSRCWDYTLDPADTGGAMAAYGATLPSMASVPSMATVAPVNSGWGVSRQPKVVRPAELPHLRQPQLIRPPRSNQAGAPWLSMADQEHAQTQPITIGVPVASAEADGDRRVVVAHLTELYQPDQNPLAGLTLEVISDIFSVFGTIQKIVCSTKPKGPPLQQVDAMIQYASPADAARALSDLHMQSITQDGHNIAFMDYSRNRELIVKSNNSRARDYTRSADQAWAADESPTAAGGGTLGQRLGGYGGTMTLGGGVAQSALDASPAAGNNPSPVVAAFITNLIRPDEGPLGGLDVDDIYNVFSPVGTILKIVCATTPKAPPLSAVTALVQFADVSEASNALKYLDNVSASGDSFNNMSLEFSSRSELHVRCNSRRSWDYTVETTAPSEPVRIAPPVRSIPADELVAGGRPPGSGPVRVLPPLRKLGTS